MNVSAPFIARPIATSLVMAGILLIGAAAYPLLPVAPLPQVDFPTIQVSAQLPGASPETVASSVATPLERQFSQIPGVTRMTSTSALGSTSVTVQFDLDRDIDAAAQDIQAAINAAGGQLPKNLPNPPTYRKVNPADSPILIFACTPTSCRSPSSTIMPRIFSASRSRRSPASPRCRSAASRSRRSASRSTRPSWHRSASASRMSRR
jgi:multidrug efflux pump subunit AcrB